MEQAQRLMMKTWVNMSIEDMQEMIYELTDKKVEVSNLFYYVKQNKLPYQVYNE